MSDAYIFDVDESNFHGVVVENSHKLPVLVDFWADWCQPCQSLIPILHKIAEDLAGQVVLAKVNSDQQQQLAQQYGVRSLPTVKLFMNGEVVDEFTGALPESEIRAMLDKYIERESDRIMAAAYAEHEKGNADAAVALMKQAADSDPENIRVQVIYLRVLMEHGEQDEALQRLERLPSNIQADAALQGIRAQLDIMAKVGDASLEELRARIEANENDFEAREKLSAVLMTQGDYQPALHQLFEIMKRDRSYNDDAGRKGLIKIFEILGNENPLVGEYRRRMSSLLF